MKRTAHSLALCLLLFGAVHAQQWCVPGAQWQYASPWFDGIFSRYAYVGDTLLEGGTGNVIRHTYANGALSATLYITRADDGVIYQYQSFPEWGLSRWDTLIWFGASPGEHWEHLEFGDWGCWCPFNVTDTGHVWLEGQWLRTIAVNNPCRNGGLTFSYTERIGSDQALFFPPCEEAHIADHPLLQCYRDDQISYGTAAVPSCSWGVGINDPKQAGTWSILPDGADHIQVVGPTFSANIRVHVIDATGRTVLTSTLSRHGGRLDVSSLPEGCYIVQPENTHLFRPLRWLRE